MPATPRVVFAAFRSNDEPMLLSWMRFRDLVHAADSVGPRRQPEQRQPPQQPVASTRTAPGHSGVWRVLASNNRELGRSSQSYASFEQAKAHVLHLQSRHDELVVTAVVGPQPGLYGWLLEHDGVPVITCGRWYAPSSSRDTAVSTVAALRDAVITEAPRSSLDSLRRSTGRRHSEAVAPW